MLDKYRRSPGNTSKDYTYDDLGRLTQVEKTVGQNSDEVNYTYDNAGNRLTKTTDSKEFAYSYNGLNQLTSSTEIEVGTNNQVESTTYTYDEKGNQITESETRGTNQTVTSNDYTVDNQLKTVRITENGNDMLVQDNLYDGSGQRISKVENEVETTYYYQGSSVLFTLDTGGNDKTTQNFLTTTGSVIGTARYTTSDISYYLYNKDIRNSTVSIVDETGVVATKYSYDEFGQTTVDGSYTFANEICYTGGIYDWSTGQYYLNARYYDPEIGRFLSEDTYRGDVNEPNTLHLYAYCANNPVNYVDPSGHWFGTTHEDITREAYYGLKKSERRYFSLSSLQSGSVVPDHWVTHYAKYHGYNENGEMDAVIKQYIATAVSRYHNSSLRNKYGNYIAMASYQIGIALHTQQDHFAHYYKKNGTWTWWKNYKFKKFKDPDMTDENHGNTFDSRYKVYINGEWKVRYDKNTYLNNPRIRDSIDASVSILKRFINKVS